MAVPDTPGSGCVPKQRSSEDTQAVRARSKEEMIGTLASGYVLESKQDCLWHWYICRRCENHNSVLSIYAKEGYSPAGAAEPVLHVQAGVTQSPISSCNGLWVVLLLA